MTDDGSGSKRKIGSLGLPPPGIQFHKAAHAAEKIIPGALSRPTVDEELPAKVIPVN